MSIYRCHVHDIIWKFAKFLSVKNKAYDKRFPYIAVLFSSPCPHRQFALRADSARVDAAVRLRGAGRRVCRSRTQWRFREPTANIGHFVERKKQKGDIFLNNAVRMEE